jgi:hypothetical protein
MPFGPGGNLLYVTHMSDTSHDHPVYGSEDVMAYMLLVIEPPGQRSTRTDAEGREVYARMVRFSEQLKQRGLLTMSQSLKTDAARVKVREEAVTIMDGPFAETKEVMGGILLLTCKTREEAIAIARECPAAQWATIEVRELGPCFA